MTMNFLSLYFVVALAVNFASLNSVKTGDPALTAMDPFMGSLFLLALWFFTYVSGRASTFRAVVCFLGGTVLSIGGVMKHINNMELYATSEAYHPTAWMFVVLLNASGTCLLIHELLKSPAMKSKYFKGSLLLCLGIAVAYTQLGGTAAPALCTDKAFFTVPAPPAPHLPFQRTSQYVAMSDGVKLAVDVYLPAGHDPHKKLPTFLHLTRYHRSEKRSWLTQHGYLFGAPPGDAFPMRSLHYLELFVPDGYAFVSVDVRGTGASFGTRPVDLMPREVQDYKEISDWVMRQPFCNGRIGTGGISYDGITGALMAAQGNVQAAALLFAPGDIYEDIAVPGGIPATGFVDTYGRFTAASERNEPVADVDNELPMAFKLMSSMALDGVDPVAGDEKALTSAVAQHAENFDMTKAVRDPNIQAKTDTLVSSGGKEYNFHDIGITHNTYKGLKKHNVSVYSIAGYFDSGSIRSAARMHNYLGTEQSKLTIGPWSHGCRACWTPGAPSTAPRYPMFVDVKRFFDCKLKDDCRELPADEPPLHYFLSGRDEWRTGGGEWPPSDLKWDTMTMCSGGSLKKDRGTCAGDAGFVDVEIDDTTTTGVVSRWNLVQHLMKKAVTYPNRAVEAEKSVTFTDAVTDKPRQIVGSVAVTLSLELSKGANDTAIFAYLEDVDPVSGTVSYITEGMVRASHRTSDAWPFPSTSRVGSFDTVRRTYSRSDMKPLDGITTVEFMLEPVAYEVPPNHQLRLVLAGADKDNFLLDNIEGRATGWRIHTAGKSMIHLPVAQ